MKRRISYLKQPDGFADITVPPAMLSEFALMVQRATSTWQDMSPDMRDFADRVLGRDHVMGSNMKEGFQSETKRVLTIKDPLGINAPDISELESARKRLATRSCCGTMLREPHLASCAELSKVKRICNNHPETCNCPVHCK